jgi:hypothetical protein
MKSQICNFSSSNFMIFQYVCSYNHYNYRIILGIHKGRQVNRTGVKAIIDNEI